MADIYAGHKGPVYALEKGLAQGTFFSGSGDGTVVKWQIGSPEKGEAVVNVGQAIFSLHHDRSRSLLLIGTEGGGLHVIDLRSKREVQFLQVHRKGIFRIVPLSDQRIACAGGDGTLSIWDVAAEEKSKPLSLYRQIPIAEDKLRDLLVIPAQEQLLIACGDGIIRILDTNAFNEIVTIEAHMGKRDHAATCGASSLSLHPHKPVLISGGKDGYIRSWRRDKKMEMIHEIPAHKGAIYRIRFDRKEQYFATCSRDGTIKIWDQATLEPLRRLDRAAGGHTHSVNSILWMDGTLISASDDRSIRAWHIDQ